MTSPDLFTNFTRLPFEIRLKIWESAIPPARIVPIRLDRLHRQYTSDIPPHALLHACTESRQVYLSIYEKLELHQSFESTIFVDFTRDTIFFDSLDCSPAGDLAYDLSMSPQSSDKILYCAIDSQLWEVLRIFRYDSLSEMKSLRNLKTLALVLRQERDRVRQARITPDERQVVRVDVQGTVGSEIQHVHHMVEIIRADLEHERELQWEGEPPNVQMWIM